MRSSGTPSSPQITSLRYGPAACGVLLLLAFCGLMVRLLPIFALSHKDEWLSMERVRQMRLSGDYFRVAFNFGPDFNKPPLQYALTALTWDLSANPHWSIALWSLLFSVGTLIVAYLILREVEVEAPWAAPLAMAGIAANGLFPYLSGTGLLDAGMVFFLLLTILGCERLARGSGGALLIGVGIVGGMLQKVPTGLIYFLLTWMTEQLAGNRIVRRPDRKQLGFIVLWLGALLAWPVLEFTRHGSVFLKQFFGKEMIQRVTKVTESSITPSWLWENLQRLIPVLLVAGGLVILGLLWQRCRPGRPWVRLALSTAITTTLLLSGAPVNERYCMLLIATFALFVAATWALLLRAHPRWLAAVVASFTIAAVTTARESIGEKIRLGTQTTAELRSLQDLLQRNKSIIHDRPHFAIYKEANRRRALTSMAAFGAEYPRYIHGVIPGEEHLSGLSGTQILILLGRQKLDALVKAATVINEIDHEGYWHLVAVTLASDGDVASPPSLNDP